MVQWLNHPLRFSLDVQSLHATGTPYMAMKSRKGAAKQKPKRTQSVSAVVARTTVERVDRRNATINVARREFVGSITNGSTTGFSIESNSGNVPGWDINPAISGMFPWLSNLARGYERFRFRKLKVSLVSSQPTSTPGRVYMAVDYDWDDLVPTTKQALMGNMTAVEAPIWSNLDIVMEPRALMGDMPHKYVSTQVRNPSNGWEPRLSYCGFLVFAFDTSTANVVFDVFVDYDVELTVPQFEGLEASSTDGLQALDPCLVDDRSTWYDGAYSAARTTIGNWTGEVINGAIRLAVSGVGQTPDMLLPNTGVTRDLPVVDIGGLSNSKILELRAPVKVSDKKPSDWISTYAAVVGGAVYDAAGVWLGDIITDLRSKMVALGTEYLSSDFAVNNKWAIPFIAIGVAAIRGQYPRARYVAPHGIFATGPGDVAGTAGIDVRVY